MSDQYAKMVRVNALKLAEQLAREKGECSKEMAEWMARDFSRTLSDVLANMQWVVCDGRATHEPEDGCTASSMPTVIDTPANASGECAMCWRALSLSEAKWIERAEPHRLQCYECAGDRPSMDVWRCCGE